MSDLQDPKAAAAHAREFWASRYQQFNLSESGWMGAGEGYNGYLYECKRQALRRALAEIDVRPEASVEVLDAGCGQGFFAGVWAREFPHASYTGVDICEKVVAHLQGRYPRQAFSAGDLAEWRHPAERRFDVIHSFEVLHLLLSDAAVERAVMNLAAHLKPGGHLLLTAALPAETVEPNAYIRHQSRKFWAGVVSRAGLVQRSARPMYYWLPDGGPKNRYVNRLLRLPGPGLMYALDRVAHALGLPQWFGSWDSRTQLMVLARK
ncbi:MAG: hypothetical protein RL514_2278 [Verrucomicrobiota bacterium]|jgi:2-polyprenyl-3-methyl-5-hydroxy-6-metoxy-1,4-benzoquinol methylase